MGGEGQSGIKTFHLTGRKTHENHFPKEIDGKGQGPMKDPEEQWLDYSISFTAEYTYTHALFKGRAFLSLLYWMLEISVLKLQITSLTSKKFPKQIALFKENCQALQMQGICSCACPGASTMVDCWIITSQLPMRRFSEVCWFAPALWSIF